MFSLLCRMLCFLLLFGSSLATNKRLNPATEPPDVHTSTPLHVPIEADEGRDVLLASSRATGTGPLQLIRGRRGLLGFFVPNGRNDSEATTPCPLSQLILVESRAAPEPICLPASKRKVSMRGGDSSPVRHDTSATFTESVPDAIKANEGKRYIYTMICNHLY